MSDTIDYKFTEAASDALWDPWDTIYSPAQCDNCGLVMTPDEAHCPGDGVWCGDCIADKGTHALKEMGA